MDGPSGGSRWAVGALAILAGLLSAPLAQAQESYRMLPEGLFQAPASASEENQQGEGEGLDEDTTEDFIETDRNSFTFARKTPGANRTILESSFSYINIGGQGPRYSFPESLLRYGVGERFELRFGYNYEIGRETQASEGDIANSFGINAEQQVYYGFKYQLTRQLPSARWRPDTAVLVQGHTPIGSLEGRSQIRAGYVWGWTLPNGWNFDSAIRFGTDREFDDGYELWAPSCVLKIPFGREKRWFTHVEYFGLMSNHKAEEFSRHFIDFGLHHFLTPNFEIGTIVAFGINDQSRGVIVNTGLGIRF